MPKYVTVAEFQRQMIDAGMNVRQAQQVAIRNVGNIVQPIMIKQAQAAAGPDRRLSRHRSKQVLSSEWKVRSPRGQIVRGYLNARGPWGIRDNSYDIASKTPAHVIRAKRAQFLVFQQRNGETYVGKRVNHPGSRRSNYWQQGTKQAFPRAKELITVTMLDSIRAAFTGSPWNARRQ